MGFSCMRHTSNDSISAWTNIKHTQSAQQEAHLVLFCIHSYLVEHRVPVKVEMPTGLPKVHLQTHMMLTIDCLITWRADPKRQHFCRPWQCVAYTAAGSHSGGEPSSRNFQQGGEPAHPCSFDSLQMLSSEPLCRNVVTQLPTLMTYQGSLGVPEDQSTTTCITNAAKKIMMFPDHDLVKLPSGSS
jgi:hypothetical protein